MRHYEPSIFHYTYGPHAPALLVQCGRSVETWTADSGNGTPNGEVIPEEQRSGGEDSLPYNPVIGPFYIEDAEPGDTLVVHLEAVDLNSPTAFGAVQPHLAVLGDDMAFVGPTGLKPPIEGRSYEWELDTARGTARVELPESRIGRMEIRTHPFLGCIGTAPRWGEHISTVNSGNHGGNLDCPFVCSNAELHLPVYVPGGLLMFGDAHAAQGDGEIAGGALETTSRVRFRCEVRKQSEIRWPRIVTEEHLITVAAGRPLLDVFRIAWVEMILWLEAECGYDRWDALHVLSQIGQARPCNVVSPSFTGMVLFPRPERTRPDRTQPDQTGG